MALFVYSNQHNNAQCLIMLCTIAKILFTCAHSLDANYTLCLHTLFKISLLSGLQYRCFSAATCWSWPTEDFLFLTVLFLRLWEYFRHWLHSLPGFGHIELALQRLWIRFIVSRHILSVKFRDIFQ